MEIKHIDFSEFHPLDHPLIECRGYPGGRRRHLEFSWDFIWKDRVRAQTTCRVGRHRFTVWRRLDTEVPVNIACMACTKQANPAQRAEALVDERERHARWEARRVHRET